MLEQAAGLSPRALDAIAELERLVVAADGGRLKLEWGSLRRRAGDRVEDLLWWDGDRLLGFLGLYSFGSSLGLMGMVAPDARRRGIGTALLDAAIPICRARGTVKALLIVPRPSLPGKRLALRRGAVLDHSEHALSLSGEPTGAPRDSAVHLRPASASDLPLVSRLLEAGFGEAPLDWLGSLQRGILVVEVNGSPVGTLGVTHDADEARIYGFVIDPARQGRGIGRAALRRACEELRAAGARRIGLEVAVDNDRALGLYTSVGFTPILTEDYYALPIVGQDPPTGTSR
ncbi:MAG TPA: GNAT family N-acetyltransferase [Solirubrobacteraceae bacterium]|nr:GNAT family N-acetyltransferase [Solirubrobacteraceae bacterium]